MTKRWEDSLPQLKDAPISTPPAMNFVASVWNSAALSASPLQVVKARLLSRGKLNWRWRLGHEDKLSIEIADTLRNLSMDGLLNGVFCHLPNEGKRHKITGEILRAMGMITGAPDFVFIGAWGGGFIELKAPELRMASPKTGKSIIKRPQGELTEAQQDFQAWCIGEGAKHAVCRSVDEVLDTLRAWGAL